MAKKSTTTFKDLVNSPIGIIIENIVNKLASETGYKPLKNFIDEIQTGKTPPMSNPEYYSTKDMEWIKPSDIGYEKYISGSDWISNIAVKENKATIYKPNTILIICIGGGIGRLGIVNKICSSNQQITGILFKKDVLPEFAYYFFLSRYKIFEENSSKSTLPIINQKALGNLDFLCPEESIQKEIVLFLEYCKQCLDEGTLPVTNNWKLGREILDFSSQTFKAYYTQKELLKEYAKQLTLIENLNQAILQEAVQGKLVPQDPTDEPANELLKHIKEEKEKLIKAKKLKSGKSSEQSIDLISEYEIPKGWIWCKTDDIFFVTKLAGFEYTEHIKLQENGEIPVVRAQNVRPLKIDKNKLLYIDKKTSELLDRCALTKKCLLITFIGAGIGDVATFEENNRWHLAPNVAKVEPFENCENLIDVKYINYFLMSSVGQKELFKHIKATAQPSLSMGTIRDIDLLIPPLSEQKRIVAEIENQLEMTKQLKAHVLANQAATEQLLKALLQEAFAVEEK